MKLFKYIFAAVFFASGGATVQAGGVTHHSNATSSAMIEFAKQYAGETINFQIEGGLQPLSWRQDLIPIWEAATGVKITRPPGPMKHGTRVIAFCEDPDGYKVELNEPIKI